MCPYMFILYMDTYRFLWYNKATMEEVPELSGLQGGAKMEGKKVSAAQRKATDKYLEKFEEIRARVPKGRKDEIKAHATAQGESVNAFINRAIGEAMERDNAAQGPQQAQSES